MLYSNLITHTQNLPVGRNVIYDVDDGQVIIRNMGQRNWMMSALPEHRLILFCDGREIAPRQGDFFTDYLLKIETRPELKLPLLEASEQVCNGADPLGLMTARNFPRRFSVLNDDNWSLQTSAYQTGGLPSAIYLCGLQCLIRVYEINKMLEKPGEAFRQVFISLAEGKPMVEQLKTLQPKPMPKKRYFDLTERPG